MCHLRNNLTFAEKFLALEPSYQNNIVTAAHCLYSIVNDRFAINAPFESVASNWLHLPRTHFPRF